MHLSQPITVIIRKRYSCRTYSELSIDEGKKQQLADYISSLGTGPFGNQPRFKLVTATEEDRKALKKLGTYGFIKDATGFIIGAIKDPENELEDFGYLMEEIILYATDLGLGSCWLGGTFTKSSFSEKISASDKELVPAVTSVGNVADNPRLIEMVTRRNVNPDRRLPWEKLFFDKEFGKPLSIEGLGKFAESLEMVRLGPSASNRQPWRIIKKGDTYHFYLQRTPGYRESFLVKLVTVADLQRIDLGIAMSHFEVTTREMGIKGHWEMIEPWVSDS
jgi:nitroreductase